MFDTIMDICREGFAHKDFEDCSTFYKELINLLRQMNYSEFMSDNFKNYDAKVKQMVAERPKEA